MRDVLDNINGYSLDEYQRKVIYAKEKAILVIAGAGAGKSLTIIGKVVHLIEIEKLNPEEILCISFTNEATINLKKNLTQNYNYDIEIYTFHKLALKILKENNMSFNISPDEFLEQTIDNIFNSNNIEINKALKICLKNNNLNNLKKIIISFINLFKGCNYEANYFLTILKKVKLKKVYKNLLFIIFTIYINYQNILKEENAIDFHDMINKALESIVNDGLKEKWKYIIIDEFQDTSLVKISFIQEIIKKTSARLLAVGDDYQSIYRFTGCDLDPFLNFERYFKDSKKYIIKYTYRNPQELINVAGNFIMKNKYQLKKELISNKHLENPVKIVLIKDKVNDFKKILEITNSQNIMVLSRNKNDIQDYLDSEFNQNENIYSYNSRKFKHLTIHASKGLEAEIVILINLSNNIDGFPNQMKDNKILNYVKKAKTYYPFDEERRMFYVALTRTKSIIYLLVPSNRSIFIKELIGKKNVELIKI